MIKVIFTLLITLILVAIVYLIVNQPQQIHHDVGTITNQATIQWDGGSAQSNIVETKIQQ